VPLVDRKRLLKAIADLRMSLESADDAMTSAAARGPPTRRVDPERRQLTLLFCDLVAWTELSNRLDPEDLREVVYAYQACVAAVVERFEGHVAKYLGDGVLVYFGYPRAHEDDAERAVRRGLAIAEAVAALVPLTDVQLQARVGIATGTAVVGDLIGEGASREAAVIGDVPNLAARMQVLAAPNTVLISDSTRRLVGGLFDVDDVGPQRLKGFAEPLRCWRVVAESAAEGRFEALHGACLTPLVGREDEIALLLRRWRQARDGEGQVVLLAGEPGIGKSRLVRELRARLSEEPHIRLLCQCSPHHTARSLHPLIEHLERAAGFARNDPPAMRLDKLEALLAHGTERPNEVVPLIAALLGMPTGERYPALTLTREVQKRRTLQALVDQVAGLAAQQPVLALFKDVHWIDPSTLELPAGRGHRSIASLVRKTQQQADGS
jgi:class 3 adenylate cyclase